MKALYIEPFYGGSHRYFADGWISRSRHRFQLLSLPARFWKWRQSGSALHFAQSITESHQFDVMVCGGMCDLAHLKALRPNLPPMMLYVHENQFAYPLSEGEERDYRYGITDLISMLSADSLVFNSRWNRESFISEAESLLARLPDAVPEGLPDQIRRKANVIHPGVESRLIRIPEEGSQQQSPKNPPLVIWNHRHEHDKNPELSFRVLEQLADEGFGFELALLGERFRKCPDAFTRVRRTLADRIVVDEYPPRNIYLDWLRKGDIVISSAIQENFGISVVEAVGAGCLPVLPRRLAYPEVIPGFAWDFCLWRDEKEYAEMLRRFLAPNPRLPENFRNHLQEAMSPFDWDSIVPALDEALENTAL